MEDNIIALGLEDSERTRPLSLAGGLGLAASEHWQWR